MFALLGQAALNSLHADSVLYQTGFEFPEFQTGALGNGNLAGQGGWQSALSYSTNAAQVVDYATGQAVELFGPCVASGGPDFYNSDFAQSLSNYDPGAAGTPIVTVSADFWLSPGPTAAKAGFLFAFLVLNDQNGNPFETIGIDGHGVVFGQNFATPNQVVVAPGPGTNSFHTLRADLNFTTRQVTFYMDAVPFGSMSFYSGSSTLLGSVDLVLQCSDPVDSNLLADNVSVTAGSGIPTNVCAIQITSAGPCLSPSWDFGTPNVGDLYAIKVVYNVSGTPYQPFRIEYKIGNVTWYSDYITGLGTGDGYWDVFTWWVNLDGPLPWSITLDPDGISGCTNRAAMTASGTFTPTAPSSPLELYNPVTVCGTEEADLSFEPGSGSLDNLWIVFGVPTSHGAQEVFSVTAPSNAAKIVTPPYGLAVFCNGWTNAAPGLFQLSETFSAQISAMRVKPALLRTNTWTQMAALSTNITQWIVSDSICQSASSMISNFVSASLPTNFQASLTPYDTARALERAVMRRLIYLEPPPYYDATNSLAAGFADCGGYASLLAACLRNVGIPARRISGTWQGDCWQGDLQWHERTEFYLPNTGWLIADACMGNENDPTGTFSWDFGFVPDANDFFAMDVGDSHVLPFYNFSALQDPEFIWYGDAAYNYFDYFGYLQPLGTLSGPTVAGGSWNLSCTNAPFEGTIILQSSTNLVSWTPVATNSASSSPVSYTFPTTKKPRGFWRSVQIP
jgi:hypothetical protein